LKDSKGETFPVVFRMYHEHTGGWFWWGSKQCTPDEYNQLYRMTVSYLRDVKGVHNILYAFSPAGMTTEAEFLSRYPGNDWVDVVGFDNYCGSDKSSIERYKKDVTAGLQVVTNYAKLNNKIPVLAETGMESIPVADYFTNILLPTIKPFNISYVLLWRNAFNKETHFYAPYPGHSSAADFKKFTDTPEILLNKEIKPMYNSEK